MSARTLRTGQRTAAMTTAGPATRPWRGRLLRWICVHYAPLRARHDLLDAPAQPHPRRGHRKSPLRPMAPR